MLRDDILEQVIKYYNEQKSNKEFEPGRDKVNYSGRVYDEKEMVNLIDSALDFWLTEGRYTTKFNKKFREFLSVKHCIPTNSGSSANLLATSALTSKKLGKRRLQKGDEVITVAAAFPTTVNPIIQNGCVPVFVDIELDTLNINTNLIEEAITEKTKAIILAHTLGNPFDIDAVLKICKKYNLWLIEDNCDSLGSLYHNKYTGTFGDIGTHSFFPAHHMTMGEGGAVITNDDELSKIIESFRHWGSDCYCKPGCDNTCGKRFSQQLGTLPFGYDHKYTYSEVGYNLKITDMQAAIGCAQIDKLPFFIQKRRDNYQRLFNGLSHLQDEIILPIKQKHSNPSWFAFPMTLKNKDRKKVTQHLEDNKIQTRLLFTGNYTKHPALNEVEYRIEGDLKHTDISLYSTFLVGLYPGMKDGMIEYMIDKIEEALL